MGAAFSANRHHPVITSLLFPVNLLHDFDCMSSMQKPVNVRFVPIQSTGWGWYAFCVQRVTDRRIAESLSAKPDDPDHDLGRTDGRSPYPPDC